MDLIHSNVFPNLGNSSQNSISQMHKNWIQRPAMKAQQLLWIVMHS